MARHVSSSNGMRMATHTQAKSLDKLMMRVREVIELCLEVEEEKVLRDCELSREELRGLL